MGRERVLFKSEEKKSNVEIVSMLRTIADRIEQGRLTLRQRDNEVVLDFPSQMTLEIKVEEEKKKRKGTKMQLEIELEWYPGAENGDRGVTIG